MINIRFLVVALVPMLCFSSESSDQKYSSLSGDMELLFITDQDREDDGLKKNFLERLDFCAQDNDYIWHKLGELKADNQFIPMDKIAKKAQEVTDSYAKLSALKNENPDLLGRWDKEVSGCKEKSIIILLKHLEHANGALPQLNHSELEVFIKSVHPFEGCLETLEQGFPEDLRKTMQGARSERVVSAFIQAVAAKYSKYGNFLQYEDPEIDFQFADEIKKDLGNSLLVLQEQKKKIKAIQNKAFAAELDKLIDVSVDTGKVKLATIDMVTGIRRNKLAARDLQRVTREIELAIDSREKSKKMKLRDNIMKLRDNIR